MGMVLQHLALSAGETRLTFCFNARMRILLAVSFAVSGCATHAAHFSYAGDIGPEKWGKLASVCADGRRQSPIDLTGAVEKPLSGLDFAYTAGPARAVHNGHTIQVTPSATNTVRFGGETWTLQQLHFHHPGEHAIDGQRAPMELHLVHKGARGLLVVGVLLADGTGGAPFEPIFNALPRHEHEETAVAALDPVALLPLDRSFFTYEGSLTVPPCTENVTWVVLKAPSTVSRAQLDAFATLFPDDSRPLQPLNARTIATPQKPAQ